MKSGNFLPYGRQFISDEDIEAVVKVLRSDFLTQGPAVEEFEKDFAEAVGSKFCVAVSNGTAALHLSAMEAGLSKGDAAIVPGITFCATSNAVLYTGATPIFADVNPTSGLIEVESIKRCIQIAKSQGLNLKAILPVHYSGMPVDLRAIEDLAEENGLKLIQDACHALGAEISDLSTGSWKPVASTSEGTACWSFHPVKHITTGEGGAITTNSPDQAKKLAQLRSHGITKKPDDFLQKDKAFDKTASAVKPWYHEMQILGYNYRLCDIQAALGRSQLSRLKSNIQNRRRIAAFYDEALQSIDGLNLPQFESSDRRSALHLYVVNIDFAKFKMSRTSVMQSLAKDGIGTQVHYIPVPFHPFYQNNGHLWLSDDLRSCQTFYESELSLPMFPELNVSDLNRVVDSLKKLFKA